MWLSDTRRVAVITPEGGELDLAVADLLCEAILQGLTLAEHLLVLDLRLVTFADSSCQCQGMRSRVLVLVLS